VVWSAANGICAKRLVPFLPELVPTLERHGHLVVTDEVRAQLLELSPATVDRLLRPMRQPHGLSTNKPGRLLKHQIPIRTFTEWTDVKPGFLEGDVVAHCGGTTDGAFLYTETEQNRGGQAAKSSVTADSVGASNAGYQLWKTSARSSFSTLARTWSRR
jgi:hypothetical protein